MSEAAVPSGSSPFPGTMRVLSDDRLARRASEGDRRAFEAIYARYNQRLYRFCLGIVGNSADAQDALQNTMVKVLRALPGEERQIQLKPWLYRIAHNESVELVRRRRGTEQLDPEQVGEGSGPEEEAALRERLRRLMSDLEELPERQRATLVMRELAGLDFDEIGAALGTAPATVRQTLYEARLSLHQMDAGREMSCTAVTRVLSDADGRTVRRRDIRAHLRSCESCRRFRRELKGRQNDFAALSPLPAAAAAALLNGILGSHGGSAGGGLAAALGGGAAKAAGTSVAVKSAATVAVVAAVGFSATRGDLVDLGLPGGGDSQERREVRPLEGATPPVTPLSSSVDQATQALGEPAAAGIGQRRELDAYRAATGPGGAAPVGGAEHADPGTTPSPSAHGSPESRGGGRGREENLPAAAEHGQQTASAHKKGASKGGSGAEATKPHPVHPPKPPHPPKPAASGGKPATGSPPKSQGAEQPLPPQANSNPPEPQGTPPHGAGSKS